MILTLNSVSAVMTMRKLAVMRSSSVRTQGGRGGSARRVEDVALLPLVRFFVMDVLGPVKAGCDRDISLGVDPCLCRRIVAEV